MRRSLIAILVLATVAVVPVSLTANTRRARLVPPPGHPIAVHSGRSTHVQHAQPLTFQGARHTAPHQSPKRATRSLTHRQAARELTRAPRSRRGRQQALLSASTHYRSGRRTRNLDQRAFRPEPVSTPTAVVSVIRPTADRPQVPSIQDAVKGSIILPTLYNDRGRLIVPAPLFGSHDILVRQNTLADQDGLGRVQDDADLDGMRAKGMLVPIPATPSLHVDDRLPYNRRYCRTWTAQFLSDLGRDFYNRFHTPLQINSAVRTVEFQVRLQRTNGNAAPAEGDTASPHLTGQAVDIGKRGLSLAQIAWLRGYLLPLIQESRVDVEEEFKQSCFHISVYRRYLPVDAAPVRYTAASRTTTSALATALQ